MSPFATRPHQLVEGFCIRRSPAQALASVVTSPLATRASLVVTSMSDRPRYLTELLVIGHRHATAIEKQEVRLSSAEMCPPQGARRCVWRSSI